MRNNSGGPAFPNEGFNGWGGPQQGMSLRDKFADSALKGFCCQYTPNQVMNFDNIAEDCYRMADAMLKAREAGNE